MGGRTFHKTEAPYPLANDAPEWNRLDVMHNGINDYMGKRLSFARIETPPKRILEIGAGSGAWAIQAAQTYPEAEILAIDISPLPPRPLPDNLKFQAVNVTQPLPFEPESFDVLPHFRKALLRFVELVKPGGWILLEEIDHKMFGNPGPGIKKFYDIYNGYMTLRNVDPTVGPLVKPTLEESGKFSEVHAQMVSPNFTGGNSGMSKHLVVNHLALTDLADPTLDHLGEVIKTSLLRASKSFDPKLVAYGITDEVRDAWHQEVEDPDRNIHVDLYFTWGRKL